MLMQTGIRGLALRHPARQRRGVLPICDPAQSGAIEHMGFINFYSDDNEIFGEGEPATYLYKVIDGAVRTHRILANGRRQIASIYVAGEVLGFETREEHTLTAEAISRCTLLLMKQSTVAEAAEQDNVVARQLWALTVAELRRMQDHILLLGKLAQQRVAGFLVEMAQRMLAVEVVDLTMSRQDIADYLGLTVETVSRSFTQLENAAAIKMLSSRRIVLCDLAALDRLRAGS